MEDTNESSIKSNNLAPIVSLSNVAPSLDSTPARSPKDIVVIPIEANDKPEVKFKTGSISPIPSLSSRSSSSSSSSEDDDSKPTIPDGGWGWVVVFASLILSVIADGISFSFGLLFGEFLDEFGASNSDTSWIGSLFLAVPLLTGPIMSALVDKYGCRTMTIIGGIIAAIGFAISSKVNSIGMMYLTFGTISGLGLGLCYVTAVVSIAFWFDKKRTLAVGIGASGTGVGTFVFSPFTSYLLKEYGGWRGTTLILGGFLLHMCVCGALMVDPDWIKEQNKQNLKMSKSGKSSKTSLMSVSSTNAANGIDINELKSVLQSGKDAEYLLQKLETSVQNDDEKTKLKSVFSSVLNLPTFIKEDEKLPIEVLEQLSSNRKLYNIILENYPSLLLCRSTSEKGLNSICGNSITERVPVTFSMKLKKHPKSPPSKQQSLPEEDLAVVEPLITSRTSVPSPKHNASFPHLKQNLIQQHHRQHYFKNMKVHRQSLMHRNAIFNVHKYRFRASSCPDIYRVSMMTLAKEGEEKWYTEFVDLVKGMFDYSLFLELHFFLMSLSTIILFVWFIVPYFYLAEFMEKSHNYDKSDASFTIANIGIANTIGMVILGWAGDQHWLSMTKTYAICLVLSGISTAGLVFFIENYVMLQVSAALFGLFISSTFSFTPGILMELVPLERFTLAYGLQLLCMGIGILLGPPYAGHIFDLTKSWIQPFYQAAIWTAVSGILIAVIPYTKNRKIIGTGDVEKVIEDSKVQLIQLILCVTVLVALTLLVSYFTVVTLISKPV